MIAANACTVGGGNERPNSCYVLTDRGTFDYLLRHRPGRVDPEPQDRHPRPAATTAPGGPFALINYFHAYVLNPAKVPNVNRHRRARTSSTS